MPPRRIYHPGISRSGTSGPREEGSNDVALGTDSRATPPAGTTGLASLRPRWDLDGHSQLTIVIPGFMPGIQLSARSGVRGGMDPGDKHRDDRRACGSGFI